MGTLVLELSRVDGDKFKGTVSLGPTSGFEFQFQFGQEFTFKNREENPSVVSKVT